MENDKYIKKWVEGSLSEEERKAFEQTEAYQSLEKMSSSLMAFKAPEYNTEEELEKLQGKKPLKKDHGVSMKWSKYLLRAAALFVAMAGVYIYFFTGSQVVIETGIAEKTEFMLPDSSFVAVNALSCVTYDKDGWSDHRQVQIDGEVFFKVAKGSAFDVITSSGTVTVLGTEFNVKNRQGFFEVNCYEGLVEVKTAYGTEHLPEEHIFRIVNGVATKSTHAKDDTPAWVSNESAFESVPFIQVIEEFERQYDVSVVTKGVDVDQLFTGKFTHTNMSLALKSISYPVNLEYQITDNKKVALSSDRE